ncbi:MAG: hypothetical protein AB7K37_04175 [Cyclobacteriaceae bacterium]
MTPPNYTFDQFNQDLLIVLVLYERRLSESEAWATLAATASCDVFVYDNSPVAQAAPEDSRVTYVHDESNPGVSVPYVTAAAHARRLKKRWLLFVDQDTSFPPNALDVYHRAVSSNPHQVIFVPQLFADTVMVSPFRHKTIRGHLAKGVGPGPLFLTDFFAANSGMLVNADHYHAIGGHDPEFPLDFSDFAFLYRAKAKVSEMEVVDLKAEHQVSFWNKAEREAQLARFKTYCTSARRMKKYTDRPARDIIIIFIRALKLTIRFSTIRYLQIAWRTWVLG